MITVENLSKHYDSVIALDGISFDVPKGQVLGFLGPNGAGKSTAIKILTTYLQASGGFAALGGFSVSREPNEVRKRVGYLPEHAPLYLEMTVFDYLGYAARARDMSRRKVRKQAIARVVSICSLFDVVGRRIGELSKGFRQRVGLAQALIHDPDILILDEPMNGLDPIQITEIRSVIRRLGVDRTVLFSTHIIPEVELACDRVIMIDQGQLVADGSPQALRAKASAPRLNVRWQGNLENLKNTLKDKFSELQLNVQFEKNGLFGLEITNPPASHNFTAEFAQLLNSQGQLRELREDSMTLEETFFKMLGRRTESHA